jgi:hypothetical protein
MDPISYGQVVAEPMDVGNLSRNVDRGKYEDLDHFASDAIKVQSILNTPAPLLTLMLASQPVLFCQSFSHYLPTGFVYGLLDPLGAVVLSH